MFKKRPRFRYFGDEARAKTKYMEAWKFANQIKQSVLSRSSIIPGPFRRTFSDGTEYVFKRVAGMDLIDIFVPQPERMALRKGQIVDIPKEELHLASQVNISEEIEYNPPEISEETPSIPQVSDKQGEYNISMPEEEIYKSEAIITKDEEYKYFSVVLNINVFWSDCLQYTMYLVDEDSWLISKNNEDINPQLLADFSHFQSLTESESGNPRSDILNLNKFLNRRLRSGDPWSVAEAIVGEHPNPWVVYNVAINHDISDSLFGIDLLDDPNVEIDDIIQRVDATGPLPEWSDYSKVPTLEDLKGVYFQLLENIKKVAPFLEGRLKIHPVINLQEYSRYYKADGFDDGVEEFVEWLQTGEQSKSVGNVTVNHWCYSMMFVKGLNEENKKEYRSPWSGRWLNWINRSIQHHVLQESNVYDIPSKHLEWSIDYTGPWMEDPYPNGIKRTRKHVEGSYNMIGHALFQEENSYIDRWGLLDEGNTNPLNKEGRIYNGLVGTYYYSMWIEYDWW